MAFSVLTDGDPIVGTAEDDFILARDAGGAETIAGGGGDDLIVGDAPPVFVVPGTEFGNGTIAGAYFLTNGSYWVETADYPLVQTGNGPHTTVVVEATAGTTEYFRLQLPAGSSLVVDLDYGVSAIGGSTDAVIDIVTQDNVLLASSDNQGFTDPGSTSPLDPQVALFVPNGVELWIRVRPAGGGTFAGGETFMLNVTAFNWFTPSGTTAYGDDMIDGGAGRDELYGVAGADIVRGGSGDDRIFGGAGADQLFGEAGDDFIQDEDDTNGTPGFDLVHGGAGDDAIRSIDGSGEYYGDTGDDLLFAAAPRGGGGQTIDGGDGSDTLVMFSENGGSDISVDLRTGATSLPGLVVRSVENYLGRFDGDFVTGTDGANIIRTSAGDDRVDAAGGDDLVEGGSGTDTLDGGTGIDTLAFETSNDGVVVILSLDFAVGGHAGGGDARDHFSNFENVTGSGYGDAISGTSGANAIDGGGGDDLLSGESGDDRLTGAAGADDLRGGEGGDVLDGGEGADTLTGGAGRDRMTGGAEADRFVFAIGDSAAANARADVITDFRHVQSDQIDLSAIDANTAKAGIQDFRFIGAAAFSQTAGELRYSVEGGTTYVRADTNGDGRADFAITLTGSLTLVKSDFILSAPAAVASVEPDVVARDMGDGSRAAHLLSYEGSMNFMLHGLNTHVMLA